MLRTRTNPSTTIDLTREGAIVGTVRYMAPEVLERRGADARSDLFSFGAILYEMITGRRAFEGDSDVRAMVSILNEQPKPLQRVARGRTAGIAADCRRLPRQGSGGPVGNRA